MLSSPLITVSLYVPDGMPAGRMNVAVCPVTAVTAAVYTFPASVVSTNLI